MRLIKVQMTEKFASTILAWHYEPPYDFYNHDVTPEGLQELLDGTYSAIVDEQNELIGYFCVGQSAQVPSGHQYGCYSNDYIDIGLGLKPELTGQKLGFEFCTFVFSHVLPSTQRLTVAKFNTRAIHLYEKLGFSANTSLPTDYGDFIIMCKNTYID